MITTNKINGYRSMRKIYSIVGRHVVTVPDQITVRGERYKFCNDYADVKSGLNPDIIRHRKAGRKTYIKSFKCDCHKTNRKTVYVLYIR